MDSLETEAEAERHFVLARHLFGERHKHDVMHGSREVFKGMHKFSASPCVRTGFPL